MIKKGNMQCWLLLVQAVRYMYIMKYANTDLVQVVYVNRKRKKQIAVVKVKQVSFKPKIYKKKKKK